MTTRLEFANAVTFDGLVVRTVFRHGRSYGQVFRWFELDDDLSSISEEQVVDTFVFRGAMKLGPAIIYERALPVSSVEEAGVYFAGNTAVTYDTASRLETDNDPSIRWPTEEESVRGFRQIYGKDYFERSRGPRDVVWGDATERGYMWMTARAIVTVGGLFREVLLWVPSLARTKESERIALLVEYLESLGLPPVDHLFEFFETHLLRPQTDVYIFQIGSASRLDEAAYRARNLL